MDNRSLVQKTNQQHYGGVIIRLSRYEHVDQHTSLHLTQEESKMIAERRRIHVSHAVVVIPMITRQEGDGTSGREGALHGLV